MLPFTTFLCVILNVGQRPSARAVPGPLENRSGSGVVVHFTTLASQFTLITEQSDDHETGTVAHSCQFCGVSYRFSSVRDPPHVRTTQDEHRNDHSRRQSTPATRIKTLPAILPSAIRLVLAPRKALWVEKCFVVCHTSSQGV